ncbi:unnamed protein product [Owenia fusiformis]|uniref:Uncharacterized protein n=1 Tax=Owenia fusiformis TaxID=6347 RepID=A0A8J1U3A0_OWEFU|nr:unnamed protein product [Owenia fusiformis]
MALDQRAIPPLHPHITPEMEQEMRDIELAKKLSLETAEEDRLRRLERQWNSGRLGIPESNMARAGSVPDFMCHFSDSGLSRAASASPSPTTATSQVNTLAAPKLPPPRAIPRPRSSNNLRGIVGQGPVVATKSALAPTNISAASANKLNNDAVKNATIEQDKGGRERTNSADMILEDIPPSSSLPDKPLISFSPTEKMKNFDFDLSSLDPLNVEGASALSAFLKDDVDSRIKQHSTPNSPTRSHRVSTGMHAGTVAIANQHMGRGNQFNFPTRGAHIGSGRGVGAQQRVISDPTGMYALPPRLPQRSKTYTPCLTDVPPPPPARPPVDLSRLSVLYNPQQGQPGDPEPSPTEASIQFSNKSVEEGNLLDVYYEDHDYMSLESFDPLFDDNDTNFEAVSDHSTFLHNILLNNKPPETYMKVRTKSTRAESQKVPTTTTKSHSADVDILDPFSVSELSALRASQKQKEVEPKTKVSTVKTNLKSEPNKFGQDNAEQPVRPPRPRKVSKSKDDSGDRLRHTTDIDESTQAFCAMVARISNRYSPSDLQTNHGIIISPRLTNMPCDPIQVKVIISAKFAPEPVKFTCDVHSAVEHVISNVLYTLCDDLGQLTTDDFILKVHGRSEYLLNEFILWEYEYIQNCMKMDIDIKLELLEIKKMKRPLLRTPQDSRQPMYLPKLRPKEGQAVTKATMTILLDTFYKEVEKLRDKCIKAEKVQTSAVIQSIKAICSILAAIETNDITKAIKRLVSLTGDTSKDQVTQDVVDGDSKFSMVDSRSRSASDIVEDILDCLENLTRAVEQLLSMFCATFLTDFNLNESNKHHKEDQSCANMTDSIIVQIGSAHRLPIQWKNVYENYKVICGLYYGGKLICQEKVSKTTHILRGGFQEKISWDEWVEFDGLCVGTIPRETRLCMTLYGIRTVPTDSKQHTAGHQMNDALGWATVQLFNYRGHLTQGPQLLGLWPDGQAKPTGTCQSFVDNSDSVLLQVSLPDFEHVVYFPAVEVGEINDPQPFANLHPDSKEQLQEILERDCISLCNAYEKEVLWEKRHYLYGHPEALARVLAACTSWEWASLADTYTMVQQWSPLTPIQAMTLLLPSYADIQIRTAAVEWIKDIESDELVDVLPQLVQALKYESYHDSALSRFLLDRSASNIRVAHQLYWLLKEAAENVMSRKRYQLMFGALMSIVGKSLRKEFEKQEELVKKLAIIAETVKMAKDKDDALNRELEMIYEMLYEETARLPLSPSLEISGIDRKSCSYFASNATPLKLVFKNVDPKAVSIYTMFKVGDDLRQDLLTLQLIRIMDKLWLKEGLDLKMITFGVLPTGNKRGLIELITESETLRKIQVSHDGVTGSFRNRPVGVWLQKHNPTELEYKKAVSHFTRSCAGYCVATYILGICDRHNDNIMLKESGHMFHIDFGKFLGDAQKFGNISRDRVPFVFTADMAYVINGGDKPSSMFQNFVDLCCNAFNIIRKNGNLFMTLLEMMADSGIPGVNHNAVEYVQKNLMPQSSDAEATAAFTRMIESSLNSVSTKFNFFIHNLAQWKFKGHQEGALLSFIPKTYSMQTDGLITDIKVHNFQKRYNPEKYYIYIIKIFREGQRVPSHIFRRYSEFYEFHSKLVMTFPLATIPPLPGKILLGRTHIKTVAEKRKMELENFMRELLLLAPEISQHDLIYTFFHPMLRDETEVDKMDKQKVREPTSPRELNRSIQGEVKLSLLYKSDSLYIMVMHAKDIANGCGEPPDPYIKTYLLPDRGKFTKKKTRIVERTFHPTFNEMLIYRMPYDQITTRTLQVTIWNYDRLKENEFMGAVYIKLSEVNLLKEEAKWYTVGNLQLIA